MVAVDDIQQLAQIVHRDPQAYFDECQQRFNHLSSQINLALASPHNLEDGDDESRSMSELVKFICSVGHRYPKTLAPALASVLVDQWMPHPRFGTLPPSVRIGCLQGLMMLRSKGHAPVEKVFSTCVPLLGSNDRAVRRTVFGYLVSEAKRATQAHIRRQLQNVFFQTLRQCTATASAKEISAADNTTADTVELSMDTVASSIIRICAILFVGRHWSSTAAGEGADVSSGSRVANVIATEGLFHPHEKVASAALHFFLHLKTFGKSEELDEDERRANEETERQGIMDRIKKGPKLKDKTVRRLARRARLLDKREKASERELEDRELVGTGTMDDQEEDYDGEADALSVRSTSTNVRFIDLRGFEHLEWLHNPQTVAEKLFASVRQSHFRFEVRMMQMDLITRLMALHELVILNLSPFFQRYLRPNQSEITRILAILVQSVHRNTPSEYVVPILKTLSDQFVVDRNDPAAISIGLNTIRSLCVRAGSVVMRDAGSVLLNDWIGFRKFRGDKGVVMAARGVLEVARKLVPSMLHRRDRGKDAGSKETRSRKRAKIGEDGHMVEIEEDDTDEEEMDDEEDEGEFEIEIDEDVEGEDDEDDDEDEDEDEGEEEDEDEELDEDQEDDGDDDDSNEGSDEDDDEDIDLDRDADSDHGDFGEEEEDTMGIVVEPGILEPSKVNNKKRTREERLDAVARGREDREKFGFQKKKGGGTTNAEKQKTKNASMVQNSRKVREKMRMSMRDKQKRKGNRRSRLKKMPKRFRK
jgi:protein SDA1